MGRHLKQDGHDGMGMARAGMQEYIEHRHREAAREMGQWVLWAASAAALATSTTPQEVIFRREDEGEKEEERRGKEEEGRRGKRTRRRREVSVAAMNAFITEVYPGFTYTASDWDYQKGRG